MHLSAAGMNNIAVAVTELLICLAPVALQGEK